MKYNPDLHHRHSIRLRGYDYANTGAYFVTICLNQRIPNNRSATVGATPRGCPYYGPIPGCPIPPPDRPIAANNGQTDTDGQINAANGQTYYHRKGQPRGVAPTITKTEFDFPTFGVIGNGVMVLNDSGKMVQQIWDEMPKYYSGVELGEFIVMPDHIHGIIKINDPTAGLPYLMDCFKTMTTTKYINGVKTSYWKPFHKKLWQRNYWEHVIRTETEYAITRFYGKNKNPPPHRRGVSL